MEPLARLERGISVYRADAGECPGVAAGDAVAVFPHYGVAEPGEVLAYADPAAPGGVSAGTVMDALDSLGDASYLVAAPNPSRPYIKVPYEDVVGEVMAIVDGLTGKLRTRGATPPPRAREGVGETKCASGAARRPRPRRPCTPLITAPGPLAGPMPEGAETGPFRPLSAPARYRPT